MFSFVRLSILAGQLVVLTADLLADDFPFLPVGEYPGVLIDRFCDAHGPSWMPYAVLAPLVALALILSLMIICRRLRPVAAWRQT